MAKLALVFLAAVSRLFMSVMCGYDVPSGNEFHSPSVEYIRDVNLSEEKIQFPPFEDPLEDPFEDPFDDPKERADPRDLLKPKNPLQVLMEQGEKFQKNLVMHGEKIHKNLAAQGDILQKNLAIQGEKIQKNLAVQGDRFQKTLAAQGDKFQKTLATWTQRVNGEQRRREKEEYERKYAEDTAKIKKLEERRVKAEKDAGVHEGMRQVRSQVNGLFRTHRVAEAEKPDPQHKIPDEVWGDKDGILSASAKDTRKLGANNEYGIPLVEKAYKDYEKLLADMKKHTRPGLTKALPVEIFDTTDYSILLSFENWASQFPSVVPKIPKLFIEHFLDFLERRLECNRYVIQKRYDSIWEFINNRVEFQKRLLMGDVRKVMSVTAEEPALCRRGEKWDTRPETISFTSKSFEACLNHEVTKKREESKLSEVQGSFQKYKSSKISKNWISYTDLYEVDKIPIRDEVSFALRGVAAYFADWARARAQYTTCLYKAAELELSNGFPTSLVAVPQDAKWIRSMKSKVASNVTSKMVDWIAGVYLPLAMGNFKKTPAEKYKTYKRGLESTPYGSILDLLDHSLTTILSLPMPEIGSAKEDPRSFSSDKFFRDCLAVESSKLEKYNGGRVTNPQTGNSVHFSFNGEFESKKFWPPMFKLIAGFTDLTNLHALLVECVAPILAEQGGVAVPRSALKKAKIFEDYQLESPKLKLGGVGNTESRVLHLFTSAADRIVDERRFEGKPFK